MKELTEIVAAWDAVRAEGREALLATVVGVSGSTYRRPGARMLFAPEGRLAGSVSGGCLEGDILKKAWWHTRDGSALVTYDSTDEDDVVWGFGLGCNGVVQVLLERVSPDKPGPLDLLRAVLNERQPGVVATVIGSDGSARIGERLLLKEAPPAPNTVDSWGGARVGEPLPKPFLSPQNWGLGGDPGFFINTLSPLSDTALSAQAATDAQAVLASGQSRTETYSLAGGGTAEVFLEAVLPPLPLVIFGANHDAVPLVRLAKELGWHVTVVDTRGARARPERFPEADAVLAVRPEDLAEAVSLDTRTAAVVMTHNYPDDRRVLQWLLASPVGYIGQLGPKARTERLLAEISDDGYVITTDHRERLHGPVGLDLGADNPEEIALSIIAEIQAARAGRPGGFLRDRRAPLHPHAAPTLLKPAQPTEQAACQLA